jgi:hypothetical protein
MSVSVVGKNVTDNLVFHIDTFNAKSYVGQPTTNLNSQISNYTGTSYCSSGEWTSDPTRFTKTYNSTISTPIGTGATLCVESGTAGYHHLSTMGGGGENGLNSISCYVYPLSTITNFTIGMLNDSGNQVSFDLSTKTITYGGGIENRSAFCTDVQGYPGWLRVGANIEGRFGGWVGSVGINTGGSYTPSSPYKAFYITGLQYEYKDHPTPYVFGTRSNTQGLLDVTRNTLVDLTNAGYNTSSEISFNGSSNYIINSTNLLPTSAYTKVAWFNTNNTSATNNIVSGGSSAAHAFWLGGGTKLYAGHNGNWYTVTSTTTISANTWYFGAVSFDTTNGWKLYVNGNLEATNSGTTTFTGANPGDIQMGSYGGANYFSGKIAMASVYNRVLSSDEILKLYNNTKARYGR